MNRIRLTLALVVLAGSASIGAEGLAPLMRAEETDRQSAAEWRRLERQYFLSSDDPRLFDDAARSAWAYVERHYQPVTGFVDATSGYGYATVWDIASGIAALYSGHALQFLGDAQYDRRIRRVLATLRTMDIVDNAAFNRVYSTRTAAMMGQIGRAHV